MASCVLETKALRSLKPTDSSTMINKELILSLTTSKVMLPLLVYRPELCDDLLIAGPCDDTTILRVYLGHVLLDVPHIGVFPSFCLSPE